jgi:lactate dehydrogenase-like 2-hydroxyacid dehydrogenase
MVMINRILVGLAEPTYTPDAIERGVTAHQAFLTQEALSEIARKTTENIIKLENREPFLKGTTL